MKSEAIVQNAAMASLLGIDPLRFIYADEDQALYLTAILDVADERLMALQKRQAQLIAVEVSRLFKK